MSEATADDRGSAQGLDHNNPGIAVIGGGPAGLIAAETLAAAGGRVTVYDRMPSVGRKFLIAGRGGLNLTHSEPFEALCGRYGASASRLRTALAAFPPDALRAWAEGLGQPTLVGSSGRVFPRAWKASPLLRAWLRRLDGLGVAFATRHRWTGFDETGRLTFDTPEGAFVRPAPDAVILALGGATWPRLGSDGLWADEIAGAGIAVAPLRPANVALRVEWSETFRSRFEGVPLKRIALAFGGAETKGEAVVTATGLEGGAVYALSGVVRDALAEGGAATVLVDLRPDLTRADLLTRLGRPRAKQSASTFLRKVAGLAPVAIGLLREGRAGALPAEAGELADLIKSVPIRILGIGGLDRAISSAGGIRFDELDDRFMLIRRPGIFAAGEMLDWEAPTGGYLLQGCFSTGVAAARGALAWMAESGRREAAPPQAALLISSAGPTSGGIGHS